MTLVARRQPGSGHDDLSVEGTEPTEPVLVMPSTYSVAEFYERGNPELALEAHKIHAEGYHAMGFVNDGAIEADGTLSPDIDKARGPETLYHLSYNPTNERDAATLRMHHVSHGQTFRDLPAFSVTQDTLYQEGIELLEDAAERGARIVEIAAFAKTREASPVAAFELLRHIVHQAQDKPGDELWFFSIVSNTYDLFVKKFGEGAIKDIGQPVFFDDERINPNISLVPAIVNPKTFIADVYEGVQTTRPDDRDLNQSLLFFTQGMKPEHIPPDVFAHVRALSARYRK